MTKKNNDSESVSSADNDDFIEVDGKKVKLTPKFLAEQIAATQQSMLSMAETIEKKLDQMQKSKPFGYVQEDQPAQTEGEKTPEQKAKEKGLTKILEKKLDEASLGEIVQAYSLFREKPADPFAEIGSNLVRDGLYDLYKTQIRKKAEGTPGTT